MRLLKAFFSDESGVAALEYAIIAAVLVMALLGVMISIGNKVNNKMTDVHDNALNGY